MKTFESFVNKEKYTTIVCPYCSHSYRVYTGSKEFKRSKQKLKAKCKCEQVFTIKLNFRQFYRKPVNLTGKVKKISVSSNSWVPVKIVNLSMSGLRFHPPPSSEMAVGDRIEITFTLDDKQKTNIHKELRITNTADGDYGGEFLNLAAEEKRLGYYLFPF